MKSKKIDITDRDDLVQMEALGGFLFQLGVKSGEELCISCDDILTEEFCRDCDNHKDGCECNDEGLGGRYMREYDDGADYED